MMLSETINRAFETNGEIKIARLEVDKAGARLVQAGLRSNPTLEVEQSSGRLVGSAGDRELSVGFGLPLDIYGQRSRRMDLARAEITLKEAEVVARQRELSCCLRRSIRFAKHFSFIPVFRLRSWTAFLPFSSLACRSRSQRRWIYCVIRRGGFGRCRGGKSYQPFTRRRPPCRSGRS